MKKLIVVILILVAAGAGYGVYTMRKAPPDPVVTTLQFSRGDVVDTVVSTGTLQAVTTVQVGSQVSGIVDELPVDFNSIVKKGQVIARLNPDILQTQLETANANLVNAQANLERQKVALEDSRTKLKRSQELNAKGLVTQADFETAQFNVKTAEAQLRSTESSIVQAKASVNKAEVDLSHTIITAPIDGIVINRQVDRGQTVNAGMSAPTLFVLAADLTKMQVSASVDESAVGRMRPGQNVTFKVDAYPNDLFHGVVQQVRLNPVTVQNVVTYATVIEVPNLEYKLKPGMTASPVTIEIARHDNVLRVPNGALRYRPTTEIYAALNQPVPPEMQRGQGGGGRNAGGRGQGGPGGGAAGATAPAANAAPGAAPKAEAPAKGQPGAGSPQASARPEGGNGQGRRQRDGNASGNSAAENRGGGDNPRASGGGGRGFDPNMTPEERRKRMEERMANMTPEQRAQFEERMRTGGGRGGRGGSAGGQGGQGGQGGNATRGQGNVTAGGNRYRGNQSPDKANNNAGGVASKAPDATTIDALFAPIQIQERNQRVYLWVNKQLKSIMLRTGIADGQWTEVLNESEIQPTMEVVTNIVIPGQEPARNQQQGNNPLMPKGPQRGGPGGGPGGGGGGGRGGR